MTLHGLTLEEALRAAMLTGPPPEMPKRERKPGAAAVQPVSAAEGGSDDPAERDKAATREAGEKARRTKRPGASGKRGSSSED